MPTYEEKINSRDGRDGTTASNKGIQKARRQRTENVGRLNPPFHPSMLAIGPPSSSVGFRRGQIRAVNHTTGRTRGRVGFLYNPTAVQMSYVAGPMVLDENATGGEEGGGGSVAGNVSMGSTGVSLLFDRTYEMWDATWSKSTGNAAGSLGCYADILALYQMFGITGVVNSTGSLGNATELPGVKGYGVGNSVDFWENNYPTGAILGNVFVYLEWGYTLRAYGRVTSFDVSFTHFSKQMVPVRCVANVGLELMTPEDAAQRAKKGQTSQEKVADAAANAALAITRGGNGPTFKPVTGSQGGSKNDPFKPIIGSR